MNLQLRGKNTEVTEGLRNYVEKRFAKLEKYFTREMTGTVTLIIERNEHIIEATIPINRFIIRAEESSHDMYTSIDNVVEKIERQVRKYKTRVNRKGKQMGMDYLPFTTTTEEPDTPEEDSANNERIEKTKTFVVKPMDVEEAIMQLELVDHDFFVFLNDKTDEIEVVYRRKGNKYGLIQPRR